MLTTLQLGHFLTVTSIENIQYNTMPCPLRFSSELESLKQLVIEMDVYIV